MRSSDGMRYGAPACCLLALLGAELWGGLSFLPPASLVLFYPLFYILPARLGLFGARCALPLYRRGEGLLLPALIGLSGPFLVIPVVERWCALLTDAGVTVPLASAAQMPAELAALLLFSCLLPAAAEEYLLRGVLMPTVRGLALPVVFSAGVFALLHANAAGLPSSLLFGVLLGLTAAGTRSLLPGMLCHFCFNASVLFLNMLSAHGCPLPAPVFAAGAAAFAALCALYFRRIFLNRPAPFAGEGRLFPHALLLGVLILRQALLL